MMGEPVVVRITLDHMRETVSMALAARTAEMGTQIQAAVDRAIDAFDFEREVGMIADTLMRDIIRRSLETTLWRADIQARVGEAMVHAAEQRATEERREARLRRRPPR